MRDPYRRTWAFGSQACCTPPSRVSARPGVGTLFPDPEEERHAHALTDEQVRFFGAHGYLRGGDVLGAAQLRALREGLEANLRFHPAWDPVLFPEKYEQKEAAGEAAGVKPAATK